MITPTDICRNTSQFLLRITAVLLKSSFYQQNFYTLFGTDVSAEGVLQDLPTQDDGQTVMEQLIFL